MRIVLLIWILGMLMVAAYFGRKLHKLHLKQESDRVLKEQGPEVVDELNELQEANQEEKS
jgi:gas vesicle protein